MLFILVVYALAGLYFYMGSLRQVCSSNYPGGVAAVSGINGGDLRCDIGTDAAGVCPGGFTCREAGLG